MAAGTLPMTHGSRRVLVALALAAIISALLGFGHGWQSGTFSLLLRAVVVALVATLVYSLFEHWPARLPRWFARWVLQVVSVGLSVPVCTLAIWTMSTAPGAPPFWQDTDRMNGWMLLTFLSLLIAPWTALAALVRRKGALARDQARALELERSELGRQALDARLQLLQAQVAPHFLFNTLANVQALVDARSPRASEVLRSLIAYLRAAVPLLHEPAATLGRELRLVQAYLELMHMRIPDRLRYALHVDDAALPLRCPPTTLLTLVENAVRHGIDPSEEGGSIDVFVQRHGDRCVIRVIDSGVGLRPQTNPGLRTGLSTLRERLELMFGNDARLQIAQQDEGGVCAELEMPWQPH